MNVALAPAAIVVAVESPVTLNPEPVTVTCEKVSVVLPVFFRVIGCELLFPTETLPKLALVGLAEGWACKPVPVKPMAAGEPDALLLSEMLPDALPADVGVYVTVNEVFAPGLMVTGALRLMV